MRKLDEKKEILYVIRTLDVLMSSGVGLEAALHSIGKGGYGIISRDFSSIMDKLSSGKSRGLEFEIKAMMNKAESDGYRRLLNTMYTNLTQNTDLIETLRKQGKRMEEDRNETVKKYIEDLGGVPETLLSIGMIGPIILAIVGLVPQILGDGAEAIVGSIDQGMINSIVNGGLLFTILGMILIGLKAHTKDPGL
ncbi:MAG: type II secretion system F family protein [Candidatus Thermoplasmatota archaeon]|nr:type II secretion system F family protein [Candidatus Thermoplasmatota archaeon]MEC8257843.1 type II secretion system F family protein [Candidatus Thermoplasmatota archaeon]